jgi:hypothetical protein
MAIVRLPFPWRGLDAHHLSGSQTHHPRRSVTIDARFRVSGLLKLQSRPGIFVCGEIIDGAVKAGMEISWPIHGDALTMPLLIRAVEFVEYAPGISGVALAIRFDEDEAENEQLLRDFLEVGTEVAVLSVSEPTGQRGCLACPCCRCLTLGERGGFEICPVCFWEDDGQDDQDANVVRGGPNGRLSLFDARANYFAFGACDEGLKEHVRPPRPDEQPDAG